MPIWPAALGLAVVGSVGGLLTASLLLLFHAPARARVVPWLVSYAVGTLLGAAVLTLLPEALERVTPTPALAVMLGGIFTFFILEKLVLWRHCHDDDDCHVHRSTATLVIIGDAVHTFVDGAVIAASALVSLPLALTTTIAAAAHEIPQEAGDFAILLAAGYSRRRALILNLASAAGGVLGAAAMLTFGAQVPEAIPYVLAFAAGNFLYVAMADLIPHLHHGATDRNPVRQVALLALGVATVVAL
jgi:zinc and cadmium transporter